MSLLNDLLDLAKLEAGKMEYTFQESDLTKICEMVDTELAAFALEKNIKLELHIPSSAVTATMDAYRIAQVFRNLVSNAIKYSKKNTSVIIELKQTQDHAKCIVQNEGVEIPEEELQTIFDKFVQSSKTISGSGGTGLGLAICKEIIGHHGGELYAESKGGGVNCFCFQIPKRRVAS